MKEMKLIMENFKKRMKEGWPGEEKVDAPWAGKPQKSWDKEIQRMGDSRDTSTEAMKKTVADIMRQYDERELHNMMYDELEDLFVNRFSDNHPDEVLPDEDQVAEMMKDCGIFKPEEKDDPMASDMEDPPGYMPGDGGNY
jgi:hypothetical protein